MFGLQRNDNAKRAKISVLFISIIIVKNINPELYAGWFYLIVELNVSQRKKVLSPKSSQKQNKTNNNNNNNNMDVQYLVTIDTTDFFMLLETSRCRTFYQNTEEEEMCQIAWCSSCRFFVVVDGLVVVNVVFDIVPYFRAEEKGNLPLPLRPTKCMRLEQEVEYNNFVALFIKENHFLSDNFHGDVKIVTESL